MPRTKTFYYCDICSMKYNTRAEAIECEETHWEIEGIVNHFFDPTPDRDGARFPDTIRVELKSKHGKNSEIVTYTKQ